MNNFSIVIPLYNEEEILSNQIEKLTSNINSLKLNLIYEIILVENGSRDQTYAVAQKLADSEKNIKLVKIKQPSYGQAFKEGIKNAKYDTVIQFDIDFWEIDFLHMALVLLDRYDIIIGSKNLSVSHDKRPFLRRMLSRFIELATNYVFHINLTDTHGMKAIKKNKIINLVDKVICTNHFFDTELLIRCVYLNYKIKELPVDLSEIRKTRFAFVPRTIDVFKELITLIRAKKIIITNK